MTILEKKSERKKKAIMNLVKGGEYSPSYALMLAEELNDNGKLLDADYEELANYLEELLAEPVEEAVEEEENAEEENAEEVKETVEETTVDE